MLPRVFLSNRNVRNATCTKCKNYLSVPPIIMESNGPICGRCIQKSEDVYENRAYFYEDLAKFMFFPCVNDIYGCTVQSSWGAVMSHEKDCKFKRITCPATKCQVKIGTSEILQHFKISHNDLILTQNEYMNEYAFTGTNTQILWKNKLLIWKDNAVIVQTKTHGNDYFFRISNLEEGPMTVLTVTLTLKGRETSNSVNYPEFKIMKYCSKYPNFSDKEKIDIGCLRNALGDHIICIFKFENDISSNNYDYVGNEKMLSELECSVCSNYMTPPIYMCSIGHSICSFCKVKLTQCPSCNSNLSNTRNFSLERITEFITYPCVNKNDGCDYMGNINDVKDHELRCSKLFHGKIGCVVNNILPCTWKGYYTKMFQHITLVHPNHYIELGCPLTIDIHNFTAQMWFFQYDRNIFRLYNSVNGCNGKIRWAVGYIKDIEKLKYIFYLDFINDKKTFVISHNCHVEHVYLNKQISPNYIHIPTNLLKTFTKENKLTFTINMIKLSD